MKPDAPERAAKARKGSPYLSPKEAAHFLKRAYKTVLNWGSLGYGPKRSRAGFHIDELERWQSEDSRAHNVNHPLTPGRRRGKKTPHS